MSSGYWLTKGRSLAVQGAAIQAIAEIEKLFPDTIEKHADEVCGIFTRVVRARRLEIPAARIAASREFMEKLQKAAEEQRRETIPIKTPESGVA